MIENILNGQPTAPIVDKLMEAFADLRRDGRILKHEELEPIIGCERRTHRYKTVVGRFKKRMLHMRGVSLCGRRSAGLGLTALPAPEMVSEGQSAIHSVRRRIGKAHAVVGLAPDSELEPPDRTRRDHVYAQTGVIFSAAIGASRALAPLTSPPTKTLPRKI